MLDPLHDPRVQILDQERKHAEEKGSYPGPQFTMRMLIGFLILLAILIPLLLFHLLH